MYLSFFLRTACSCSLFVFRTSACAFSVYNIKRQRQTTVWGAAKQEKEQNWRKGNARIRQGRRQQRNQKKVEIKRQTRQTTAKTRTRRRQERQGNWQRQDKLERSRPPPWPLLEPDEVPSRPLRTHEGPVHIPFTYVNLVRGNNKRERETKRDNDFTEGEMLGWRASNDEWAWPAWSCLVLCCLALCWLLLFCLIVSFLVCSCVVLCDLASLCLSCFAFCYASVEKRYLSTQKRTRQDNKTQCNITQEEPRQYKKRSHKTKKTQHNTTQH